MNTQIEPFDFNGYQLRVIIDDNGNPWFIAKEVAEILGYSDPFEMTKRLDDDEIQNLQIAGFGNRGVNIINESGLYNAILGSKKPEAKPFRKKVTSEILPAIRKTGSYQAKPQTDRLQGQLEALQRHALRTHPRWKKLVQYKKLRLTHVEIGKLLGLHVSTVRKHVRQLEACGLLSYAKQIAVREV